MEPQMKTASRQVIVPPGPATSGRISGKQVADSPDSSSEELQMEPQMEPPSRQVIVRSGPATSGRVSGKQVADSPDSSNEASQMASASSGSHEVNIDELSAVAEEKLLKLPPLSSECCIYIVPDAARYSNDRLFTPGMVSIGPIHYQNEKLRANEHLKERYLAEFRQHTGVSLKECYKLILNRERRLRNCYAGVIHLNSENFVKMVMMDAAFLLMVLVYNVFGSFLLSSGDQIFGKPKMMLEIRYDILLLENQLPFFILEDLFKLSKFENFLKRKFNFNIDLREEAAIYSLSNYFFQNWSIIRITKPRLNSNAVHMLDLLRSYSIPEDWTPKRIDQTIKIPNAKELHQAGVKIQVGSEENIFDISFHDGILKVPPLEINDSSELIFRNVLAFELCHCLESIFSDYLLMMQLLTLSLEGTELLIQKGVFTHGFKKAEMISTLFQNIGRGNIYTSKFVYGDVIKGLNEYNESDWHKWKTTCCLKYFKAPWAICSASAAVLLLIIAIVQTVFTILQVVLPK